MVSTHTGPWSGDVLGVMQVVSGEACSDLAGLELKCLNHQSSHHLSLASIHKLYILCRFFLYFLKDDFKTML